MRRSPTDYYQYIIRTNAEFRRPTGAYGSRDPQVPVLVKILLNEALCLHKRFTDFYTSLL